MQVTISDAIRYIGVDDKDIDLFESQYVVPEGVSYNSYVILDEKIAVMDTVPSTILLILVRLAVTKESFTTSALFARARI